MPRTAGYRHHEDTRNKIKAAMLINRLQDHVEASEPLLDASQVNAAKALLSKVLPDLSAVTLGGDPDNPVIHEVRNVIVDSRNPGSESV